MSDIAICRLLLRTGRCAGQTLLHPGTRLVQPSWRGPVLPGEDSYKWLLDTLHSAGLTLSSSPPAGCAAGSWWPLAGPEQPALVPPAGRPELPPSAAHEAATSVHRLDAEVLMLQLAGLGYLWLQHMDRTLQHMTASDSSMYTWCECGLAGRCIWGWGAGQCLQKRGQSGTLCWRVGRPAASRDPQGQVAMCIADCGWHPHLIFGCPSSVHKHIFDAVPAEGAPPGQPGQRVGAHPQTMAAMQA